MQTLFVIAQTFPPPALPHHHNKVLKNRDRKNSDNGKYETYKALARRCTTQTN